MNASISVLFNDYKVGNMLNGGKNEQIVVFFILGNGLPAVMYSMF